MKTTFLSALFGVALTVTLCAATSDELRAEAEKLVDQAKQAKSQGRADEAQALMERVKAIKNQVREQLEATGGAQPAAAGDERSRREAEEMRQQIEKLRRNGENDAAERLERKYAASYAPRDAGGPERLRHVQEAIEHLRAAGLPDRAEDLTRLADKLRFELEHRDDSAASPPPDKTQNALRELREAALKSERQGNDLRASLARMEGQFGEFVRRTQDQMEKMQRQIDEARTPKPRGE